MTFNNLMIDIETFGTSKDSVVVSIAAVPFNDNEISDKHYFHVLPIQTQLELGRTIDQDTWNWWSEQHTNPISKPSLGNNIIPYMVELSSFILDVMGDNERDFKIWANPPQFDISILEDLYQTADKPAVWNPRQMCDVRTVKKTLGTDGFSDVINPDAHNPIEDCIYQIKIVQKYLNIINLFNQSQTTLEGRIKSADPVEIGLRGLTDLSKENN